MKNFKIKITGEGTLNQITVSLNSVLRELQYADVYENGELDSKTIEDPFLCTEIEEEEYC